MLKILKMLALNIELFSSVDTQALLNFWKGLCSCQPAGSHEAFLGGGGRWGQVIGSSYSRLTNRERTLPGPSRIPLSHSQTVPVQRTSQAGLLVCTCCPVWSPSQSLCRVLARTWRSDGRDGLQRSQSDALISQRGGILREVKECPPRPQN